MFIIVVWWGDRTGIVTIIGPWRVQSEAEHVAETLGVFSDDKIFEVRALNRVIYPPTVE